MVTIPTPAPPLTPEQYAKKILREFYKGRLVGDGFPGLNLPHFVHPDWTQENLEAGLNYCSDIGWLTTDKWILTEDGHQLAESL